MGSFSPSKRINLTLKKIIEKQIIKKTWQGLKEKKIEYNGILFFGLMISDNKPYVIEYNVRFGDPECQITLPLIKTDLYQVLKSAAMDELASIDVDFYNAHAATVVLASKGYPASPIKGLPISGISVQEGVIGMGSSWINHAGTKLQDGKFVSSGGRVLSIVAQGENFDKAFELAYSNLKRIKFEGMHFRKDIGYQVRNI